MLDCLPQADDWSAESQYALLCSELAAAESHLQALQNARQQSVQALLQSREHLLALNQCCLDADALLRALGQQPPERLQSLTP